MFTFDYEAVRGYFTFADDVERKKALIRKMREEMKNVDTTGQG